MSCVELRAVDRRDLRIALHKFESMIATAWRQFLDDCKPTGRQHSDHCRTRSHPIAMRTEILDVTSAFPKVLGSDDKMSMDEREIEFSYRSCSIHCYQGTKFSLAKLRTILAFAQEETLMSSPISFIRQGTRIIPFTQPNSFDFRGRDICDFIISRGVDMKSQAHEHQIFLSTSLSYRIYEPQVFS